jgi:predicted metal-dependent peptidase
MDAMFQLERDVIALRNLSTELEREYLALMRHPEVAWYGSVMLLGKKVIDKHAPTAYTDGLNSHYGETFFGRLTRRQRRYLILHEEFHKAYKHVQHFQQYFKINSQLTNIVADYIVNDLIESIHDKSLVERPTDPAPLYDPMFHGWSFMEIWHYLTQGQPPDEPDDPGRDKPDDPGRGEPVGPGRGKPEQGEDGTITIGDKTFGGDTMDEHDFEKVSEMSIEEIDAISNQIGEALQQGGILAGKMGQDVPRAFREVFEPKVNWRAALAEHITACTRGSDEYTWRKYNRRRLATGHYLPSTHNETVREVTIAIDLSGSIGEAMLSQFAGELASICATCSPERVRVLWWDTNVNAEQIFEDHYEDLANLLKPKGGGGTRVGCVSDYIAEHQIESDCLVVLTDGHVEKKPVWSVTIPTLWLVTANERFVSPSGHVIKMDN